MKYQVVNEGIWFYDQPCDDAKIIGVDKDWFDNEVWGIEINTLEELNAFREKHGRFILRPPVIDFTDGLIVLKCELSKW